MHDIKIKSFCMITSAMIDCNCLVTYPSVRIHVVMGLWRVDLWQKESGLKRKQKRYYTWSVLLYYYLLTFACSLFLVNSRSQTHKLLWNKNRNPFYFAQTDMSKNPFLVHIKEHIYELGIIFLFSSIC